jgi:hypothetical protein
MRIPLCVPYELRATVRRAGARWEADRRVWTCGRDHLNGPNYDHLRRFVPIMYRLERTSPYLQPRLVPQSLWGKNLRALLTQDQWDVVRKAAYRRAGYRCKICGEQGPQWPVEADEVWAYDDMALTHTLMGVVALCPDCHHVRHWGKTMIDGNEVAAFAHIVKINRFTRADAERLVAAAMTQWEQRSRLRWSSDYSWVTRAHDFAVDANGLLQAEQVNRTIVAEARMRADPMASFAIAGRPPAAQAQESYARTSPKSGVLARFLGRLFSLKR